MSLKDELKAFQKTPKFQNMVYEKMKHDPTFGLGESTSGTKQRAVDFGHKMREILQKKIANMESIAAKELFLGNIIVKENFIKGSGWVIDVSFDEDEVTSNSLYWQNPEYEMGAYLPVLFNEGYDADNYVYGYDNYGNYIRSKRHRDAEHFIQDAVDEFNLAQKGEAIAQYSSRYSGGTL